MLKSRPNLPSIGFQKPYRRPQFYEFSSRNKRGNRPHPQVIRRREQILNMYWEHRTIDEIAVTLDIANDTVRDYIKRARRDGDERAIRRAGLKRIMQAEAKRKQIIELAGFGYTPAEIAQVVNSHVRLVQLRLKEARNAGT
jgi:DNA-directed RNA polymerase specialized sigma24 family protein